ncbi:MAG: hypothetical protein ACYC2P_04135 [Paludibacteraceae bacterium]
MKKLSSTIVLLLFTVVLLAQEKREPPIPVEVLFGNQRVNLTVSVNKSIGGNFRYLNTTTAAAYYDYTLGRTELVSVNSFAYQFTKNFGLSAGIQYHFIKGFIPNVAMHFSYADPTWLLVLTPYYNFMPWSNLETVGIVEFKPALTGNLRLFTRLQGFYSHDFEKNERERGMCYFRLGLTVNKYTVGFGANLDYYRPTMNDIQNYGGFFRVDI